MTLNFWFLAPDSHTRITHVIHCAWLRFTFMLFRTSFQCKCNDSYICRITEIIQTVLCSSYMLMLLTEHSSKVAQLFISLLDMYTVSPKKHLLNISQLWQQRFEPSAWSLWGLTGSWNHKADPTKILTRSSFSENTGSVEIIPGKHWRQLPKTSTYLFKTWGLVQVRIHCRICPPFRNLLMKWPKIISKITTFGPIH